MPNRARHWPQMTDAQFYLCVEKRVTKGPALDAAYEVLTQGATIPEVLFRYPALNDFTIRARIYRTLKRYNQIEEAFCNGSHNR